MNVTINGQQVVKEPPIELMTAALALLSPTEEDLIVPLRERIMTFEGYCKEQPQLVIPVKHKFIDGLYRREVTFPKDFVGTGKVHKVSHMDEMLTGEMLVATEDGVKHLKAPCSLVTVPGMKKFGVALKETTWVTFHPTKCTTVEAVEAEIMCDDWTEIELNAEYEDLTDIIESRADFRRMLLELGVSAAHVREQSEFAGDRLNYLDAGLEIQSSNIEGLGVIAVTDIKQGQCFLARTEDGLRADPGRYTNHSGKPNCEMRIGANRVIFLVALQDIADGTELTCDYRTSVKVAKELACQV